MSGSCSIFLEIRTRIRKRACIHGGAPSCGESQAQSLATRELAKGFAILVEYHEALMEKYQRGADRPWSSLEPDPPLPGATSR